jgi:glucose-6-phosphate 1-dehydrogenase
VIVVETDGVGTRGGYYDHAGAMRDFLQNHLLQLLSATAMESPRTLDADDIRDQKVAVLRRIKRQTAKELRKNIVLGQYTAGVAVEKKIASYIDEPGVRKDSRTETFVAAKLAIANKRWQGVPFYLRTGKALTHRYAEIAVTFKQVPCTLFCGPKGALAENKLIIRIQPDEGMKLQFNLKEPNADYSAVPYTMDYSHEAEFGMNTAEAYERLLYAATRRSSRGGTRSSRRGVSPTTCAQRGRLSTSTRQARTAQTQRSSCSSATAGTGQATRQ